MRVVQATALVAVCGLFGLLVWKLTHQSKPAKVGGPVPNFSLKRLDGDRGGRLHFGKVRGWRHALDSQCRLHNGAQDQESLLGSLAS